MKFQTVMKWSVFAVALLVAACGIPEDEHNAVKRDLEDTKLELAETQKEADETEEKLEGDIEKLEDRIAELEDKKAGLEEELEEKQGTLEMYEDEHGSLEERLETTNAELEELREARKQTEERLNRYRDIARQLNDMVEAGQLSVDIRDGKMVIQMPNNILFDSGSTSIKEDGQEALTDLAEVLEGIEEREFLVAGHTDNVPISSGRFDSNWELSTARAVEVVRQLEEDGVSPDNMAAAGYGEHDPVASNDDEEGRAQNRRIEIIVMPNLDELPELPDDALDDA